MKKFMLPIIVFSLTSPLGAFGRRGNDPFADLFADMREMQQRMDEIFKGSSAGVNMNTRRTDDAIIVEVAAPGMNEEDFKIEVLQDRLYVSGERKEEEKGEKEGVVHRSVKAQSFSQSFALPALVNVDDTKATYENGILTITMPLKETSKPRTVSVTVSTPLRKKNK